VSICCEIGILSLAVSQHPSSHFIPLVIHVRKRDKIAAPFARLCPGLGVLSFLSDDLARLILLDLVGKLAVIPRLIAAMNTPDILRAVCEPWLPIDWNPAARE
jgi:hypothetical protein